MCSNSQFQAFPTMVERKKVRAKNEFFSFSGSLERASVAKNINSHTLLSLQLMRLISGKITYFQ